VIPRPASLLLAALASAPVAAGAAEPPPSGAPVLSLAWISDMHLDASRRDAVARAIDRVDADLAPDLVLITGDNCALAEPSADPAAPEPESLRRQRFLKTFLAARLRDPAFVIPGDNWPQDFERVFGPRQYSFDAAGVHVVMLSADRSCHAGGLEGLSVFDAATWEWLRQDLAAARGRSTLLALHEPVYPPTFLDAPPLRDLLRKHPDVLAVLQGHLHVDLALEADGRAWLVAPSLGWAVAPPRRRAAPAAGDGPSPDRARHAPALKQVLVFPDVILVRTFAFNVAAGRLVATGRETRVAIPAPLRAGLVRPAGGVAPERRDGPPPRPHVDDPSMASRAGELLEGLRGVPFMDLLRAGLEAGGRPDSGAGTPPGARKDP